MLKINKQTITLTKGDDASLRLVPRYKDRTEYVLTEGDKAVFRIKFGHTLVELDCTLNLETNKIVTNITPNDTKDFNPGIYRYEAELITSFGFHYTFIADQTFILGQEYEQRITSTSNGNSSAVGGNLPEIDGIVDGEPVVYGDIQPTNPMMDYEELNHLPKLNGVTIKGDHDSEYYGIATKTSELENDSDFVSDDEYVHTDNNYDDTAKGKVDALGTASTYDVPESGNASTSQVVKGDDTRLSDNRNPNPHTHSKADITDFPTNVSAFNNDSGFITNTVNNLANYYLKADTYTKTEVEQLIAAIKQGKFEIVAELPASGDANVIYLVPKSTAQTSNSYDEYVYINNAWEKIGDTDIDLSGYVTDDELTTALQSYLTTSAFNTAIASYYTKTETDNQLANKVDKVAGKGLSTNDYDNTAKGIVDGVTSALNDKVDKVQGKGLSTNDYDNTAKGIVDGVTSALADKVDKENGKGLSTNDFTNTYKDKLDGISENANKVESSETNGNIQIDGTETQVYDDTEIKDTIEDIDDIITTDESTVEGNPINFTTLSTQHAKSTILSLEPIQDLHGYDKPWTGGAGKNLLKAKNYASDDYDGTVFTDVGYDNLISEPVTLSAGTYTVSIKLLSRPSTNRTITFRESRYSGTEIGVWNNLNTREINTVYSNTVTLSESLTISGWLYGSEGGTFKIQMMIEKSSTATSFAPYENICPISGRTEIGILGCGKNLWSDGDESFTLNKTIQLDKPLEVGKYTFSALVTSSDTNQSTCRVNFMDVDNTEIVATYIGRNTRASVTANLSRPCKSIILYASTQYSYSVDDTALFKDIQLEQGEQPTDYSPYTKSNDLTISLGQTVYGGTLDVENGVLVVTDKKITLNSLEWVRASSIQKFVSEGDISDAPRPSDSGAKIVSSAYKNIYTGSPVYMTDVTNGCIGFAMKNLTSSRTAIVINDTRFDNATNFLNEVGNETVVYPLATPITLQLTPNEISLLEGVNNISTDGDKITLTYRDGKVATLGDLTSAVDSLDSKIDESKILTDTATGDKYILVVTNGVLDIQQISN